MMKTIALLSVLFTGVACAQVPGASPLTVNSRGQYLDGIEVYRAAPRTFALTFQDGTNRTDLTGHTVWMAWSTNETAATVSTATCAVVSATGGTATATFSAAALNHAPGLYWYQVGAITNGSVSVVRHGRMTIRGSPYASGASAIVWTSNVVWGTFNPVGWPVTVTSSNLADGLTSASNYAAAVAASTGTAGSNYAASVAGVTGTAASNYAAQVAASTGTASSNYTIAATNAALNEVAAGYVTKGDTNDMTVLNANNVSDAGGNRASLSSIVTVSGETPIAGNIVAFGDADGFSVPVRNATAAEVATMAANGGCLTEEVDTTALAALAIAITNVDAVTLGGLTAGGLTGGLASAESVTGLATRAEVTNHLEATGDAAHSGMVTNPFAATMDQSVEYNSDPRFDELVATEVQFPTDWNTGIIRGYSVGSGDDPASTSVVVISKVELSADDAATLLKVNCPHSIDTLQEWTVNNVRKARVDGDGTFHGSGGGLTNIPAQYVFSDPAPALGVYTIASTTEARTVRKVRTHALLSGSAVADLCVTAWTSGATVAGTTLATLTFSTTAAEYSITGAWAVADSLRLNVTNVATGTTNLTMEAFTW
jgi:hypothetical protein